MNKPVTIRKAVKRDTIFKAAESNFRPTLTFETKFEEYKKKHILYIYNTTFFTPIQ